MENYYDVIIIGAGPSGIASAITLGQKKNLKILLVDKASFPRDKICGDGLTGDSIRCLKNLGLWQELKANGNSMPKVKLYPFNDSRYFTINSEIVTLPRVKLDKILLDKAVSRPNCLFKQLIFEGEMGKEDDLWRIMFSNPSSKQKIALISRFVIIAAGCQSGRKLYPVKNIAYKQPDLIAVRGYYNAKWDLSEPQVIFLDSSRKGYFWAFPMGQNVFNVGCGVKNTPQTRCDLKSILAENVAKLNSKYQTEGFWKTEPKGAFLSSGLKNYQKASSGNILFAGETIGSTYPFTGEGIGKALETGILAGKSILESIDNNIQNASVIYNRFVAKEIAASYRPYKIADAILTNKFCSALCFKFICSSRRIQNSISEILSEKRFPVKFSITKSLLNLLSGNSHK